jgi:hypothetical protein
MNVIYKYKLDKIYANTNSQEILIPLRAQILKVGCQEGCPVVWFLINKEEVLKNLYQFEIYFTGEEFRTKYDYFGTFETKYGIVGHVFGGIK